MKSITICKADIADNLEELKKSWERYIIGLYSMDDYLKTYDKACIEIGTMVLNVLNRED